MNNTQKNKSGFLLSDRLLNFFFDVNKNATSINELMLANTYVLYGGRQSGKTRAVINIILQLMLETERNVVVFRKVGQSMDSGIVSEVKKAIQESEYFTKNLEIYERSIRVKKSSYYYNRKNRQASKANNQKIEYSQPARMDFNGLDGRGEALKGKGAYSVAFIDEAVEIMGEQYTTLRNSLSRYATKDIPFRMFICFNPRYEDDWVYDKFVKNYEQTKQIEGDKLKVLNVNYYDNPFLNEQARQNIENDKKLVEVGLLNSAEFEHIWLGKLQTIGDAFIKDNYIKKLDYNIIINKQYKFLYLSCDYAVHGGQHNDYSALCLFGVDNQNDYFLIEPHLIKGDWVLQKNKTKELVVKYFNQYKATINLLIEEAANGSPMIRELQETGFRRYCDIIPFKIAGNSKEARVEACLPHIQAGRFYIPHLHSNIDNNIDFTKHLAEYYNQLTRFPNYRNDDAVDATTQFILHYNKHFIGRQTNKTLLEYTNAALNTSGNY